jgi:hypothetical protein
MGFVLFVASGHILPAKNKTINLRLWACLHLRCKKNAQNRKKAFGHKQQINNRLFFYGLFVFVLFLALGQK